MTLSDRDILTEIKSGRLVIKPFKMDHLQPSSVDLLLGYEFKIFRNTRKPFLDIKEPVYDYMEDLKIAKHDRIILHPGEFILGSSIEYIKIPNDLIGRLDGKSSLGRLGLVIHATAGFFDPGFEGQATYEISNLSNMPIAIYGGIKIAQMSFHKLSSPVLNPYGTKKLNSKYKGQRGPTPSKMYLNFKKKK